MKIKKLTVRDFCLIGIFTAITAICAQISIPLPLGVQFTLQTFAVPLAAIVLGAKRGCIALIVYMLLGAVGAPVFSPGTTVGIARIAGPTGGYILSYPIMALIIGWGADRRSLLSPRGHKSEQSAEKKRSHLLLPICLIAGAVINLTMGSLWLAFVNQWDLQRAFLAGFAPFIIFEIVKMALAFAIGVPTRKTLEKGGILR